MISKLNALNLCQLCIIIVVPDKRRQDENKCTVIRFSNRFYASYDIIRIY
jgi:hypothetical protein